MKLAQSLSAAALAVALAAGFVAAPAFAEVPKAPVKISEMDKNKNGRIEKEEFMEYMGKAFDKSAGAKGYCTFEEVKEGFPNFLLTPTS